jgi:large subunit ribosomal protein L18
MNKSDRRTRRARRTRAKIRELGAYRLCIHRTPRHIYAQLISPGGDRVLASASTLQKELRGELKSTGNKQAAAVVGKSIA